MTLFRFRIWQFCAAATCVAWVSQAQAAPANYTIVALESTQYINITPVAINEQGQIGLTVLTGPHFSDVQAAVFTPGSGFRTVDRPRCAGAAVGPMEAKGIDQQGDLTGDFQTLEAATGAYLYRYSTNTTEVIAGLSRDPCALLTVTPPQAPPTFTVGAAINRFRQVAGSSETAYFIQNAFVFTPGKGIIDMGLGGTTQARAINDAGSVTGQACYRDGVTCHAFLYSQQTGTMKDIDMGSFGGVASVGVAINQSNVIAGYVTFANGDTHAFTFSEKNGFLDLGPSTAASAINDLGQVVGSTPSGAFLYTLGQGIVDLNTLLPANSGWKIRTANGINNHGQIVGLGEFNANSFQAYVMTPAP